MIYSVAILLLFSVTLLIFDRSNRYSLLFVIMGIGSAMAFSSLILCINIFSNYYFYTTNRFFALDYRIFSLIVSKLHVPLTAILRIMNVGLVICQISSMLFANEVLLNMEMYRKTRWTVRLFQLSIVVLPAANLVFCDPKMSLKLYFWCHRLELFYMALRALTVLHKLVVIATLMSPVFVLIHYCTILSIAYLRRHTITLAVMMLLVQAGFVSLFYIGPASISAGKLYTSGFWIFENVSVNYRHAYSAIMVILLFLMTMCLIVLLSFRLDLSTAPFLERRVRSKLKLMNETLGDTLHSHKNTLFSIQLHIRKLRKQIGSNAELERLDRLVSDSLNQTARMLDSLRSEEIHFLSSDLSQIILSAVNEVYLPDNITLRIEPSVYRTQKGHYDRYHMEKALINILCNAVEAIQMSGKEQGSIDIRMAYFFQWVVIMIEDTGTGISRRMRRNLFLPHYSNKQGRLNWGLGLAYVFRIVKVHFGQIKIHSKEGEFTQVLIMLPISKGGKHDQDRHCG